MIHKEFLKTGGTDWNAKAMTTAVGTYYSDALPARLFRANASLLVLTSAGSLAITFELSNDKKNWYTPYDIDRESLGRIVSALTGDRWICFDAQVAEWIRFKFVLTSANSTVSAQYQFEE